jgi:hypothetical protein
MKLKIECTAKFRSKPDDLTKEAHLRAQLSTRSQSEGAKAHQPDSPTLGASSSQQQVPD